MYFIFDMDETLANTGSIQYYIATLSLKETVSNKMNMEFLNINKIKVPPVLLQSLDKSYKHFVELIIKEETSKNPLGILRPGILKVMSKLYTLQKAGKIKCVVIYSNNRQLKCVEFIRDLIHSYLGTTRLIRECIHAFHPLRIVNLGDKTLDDIKNVLIKGKCRAPKSIEQEKIYFFDNFNYVNFYNSINNFYNVPSYNGEASPDRVSSIYRQAICNVNSDMYVKYMKELIGEKRITEIGENPITSIDDIIVLFKTMNKKMHGQSNIEIDDKTDYGINMMMDAIKKVSRTIHKTKKNKITK